MMGEFADTSTGAQGRGRLLAGLGRAAAGFRVSPEKFLEHLRRAHGLPIQSFEDMFCLPMDAVDRVADQTIAATKKIALLEGAGVGMGGLLTLFPDMSFLAVISMRMLQKLSLVYGFEYATEEENAELWIAAASAAGVDLGRELMEKQVVERFAPGVMDRIGGRIGAEVAEKWAGRVIPVLSGVIGGALNYYFIREWARRAKRHFRARHLLRREILFPGTGNILPFPTATPPRLP